MKELEDNREYTAKEESNHSNSKDNIDINGVNDSKGSTQRYYLRQRKIDYHSLISGRSQ